jgi:2,3-bisphosphoglycerate-independent phosphoglycerate mutase
MGIRLGADDVAFRCNLVSLGSGSRPTMEDFTAGHISTGEGREIIAGLHEALGSDAFAFHPGVSYRHLLVWKGGGAALATTPPHDITGQEAAPYFPQGEEPPPS